MKSVLLFVVVLLSIPYVKASSKVDSTCLDVSTEVESIVNKSFQKNGSYFVLGEKSKVLFEKEGNISHYLMRGFIDGLISDDQNPRFGYGHWILTYTNNRLSKIYSVSGNASSYTEFERMNFEEEALIGESRQWFDIKSCF